MKSVSVRGIEQVWLLLYLAQIQTVYKYKLFYLVHLFLLRFVIIIFTVAFFDMLPVRNTRFFAS